MAFFALVSRARSLLLLLALAPFALVYAASPDNRVYSIHGIVHTGMVYRAANGDLPPDNPYFAGEPIQYPWLFHVLVAWIAEALNIPPSWVFAGVNLASLGLILVLVAKISAQVNEETESTPFAVLLAVFASISLLASFLLERALPGGSWITLGLPLARKLGNVNAMPLGVMFFLLGVHSLLALLGARAAARHFSGLFAAVCCAGLIYPFAWLGLCAALFPALGAALVFEPRTRRKALIALAMLVAATASIGPYLRSLTAGKAPDVTMQVSRDPRALAEHLVHLVVMLSPLWVLIALRFKELAGRLREGHRPSLLLVLMACALLATYVFVSFPLGAEYKFETLAVLCLGVLAAPTLAHLYRRRRALALLAIAFLLFPVSYDLTQKFVRGVPVAEPFVERGFVLEHGDERESEMYRWIASETPLDAVFLDTRANLPAFGRRSVYVAGEAGQGWNGWSRTPDSWLHHMHGYAQERIDERHRIVEGVYGKAPDVSDEDVVAALERFGEAGRTVYALARDAEQDAALASHPYLSRVSGRNGWAVYRFSVPSER